MKTISNATITEYLLYDAVGGSSPKPIIKTEYYSDTSSTWKEFEDIENRSLKISTINKRYDSYSFMPPVKEMSMDLNNFNQIYSTGSGNPKASILKKNLLVRCWSGYKIPESIAETIDVSDDFISTTKFYHTKKVGSTIKLDIATHTAATFATAAEMSGPTLGLITYGTIGYGYPGYYTKTFRVLDDDPISLVTNVSSNKFSLKYRISTESNFTDTVWSNYVTLSTGSNTIDLNTPQQDQYVQYMCRFNQNFWTSDDTINSVNLKTRDTNFLFKRGVFVIDEPIYNDRVNVKGRDKLKKALETEINLPDLTTTKLITTRLTEVFDRCNIPYLTANWDSISTTCEISNATIAEDMSNKSAWKYCDFLMDAVNAGSDDVYFSFDENGNALIKKRETDQEADWVTHYKFNIENVSKNFDSDSQLQRVTSMNKSITVDSEITMAEFTGTASGTSLHLTYGTTALYVRYTDDTDAIISETDRTNTAVDFSVNSGAEYDIKLFGCHPKNITDEIWEERGNSNNIKTNDGSTYKRVNPFFDKSKGKAFVNYVIDRNADPKFKMTVSQQANPLLEVGLDNVMVFDKYSFTDNIYGLESVSESWKNPSLKETLVLRDRGFDLGEIIWDKNGFRSGINDLKWDIGFVWDLDLGPNALSDPTDYSRTKSVKFS